MFYREEPSKAETLTYQSVLQNELLGKSISEVPVSFHQCPVEREGAYAREEVSC